MARFKKVKGGWFCRYTVAKGRAGRKVVSLHSSLADALRAAKRTGRSTVRQHCSPKHAYLTADTKAARARIMRSRVVYSCDAQGECTRSILKWRRGRAGV